MKQLVLFAICCLNLNPQTIGQKATKTILGIFPHPDDENWIGAVFAKYARLGHQVYVIIATDGKDGTRVTKIPAGDSLGKLRLEESRCACNKLGVNPPIYLHIDRLDTKIGVSQYLISHKKLIEDLKKYIRQLEPDLLITFGPDGEYGHAEHIVTGATVTDVLLQERWVEKYPLYFPADIKDTGMRDNSLRYVDGQYLNVKISYSDQDEQKSFDAARCYVTQNTPEEINEFIEEELKDKSNTKFFRKFTIQTKVRNEFWGW